MVSMAPKKWILEGVGWGLPFGFMEGLHTNFKKSHHVSLKLIPHFPENHTTIFEKSHYIFQKSYLISLKIIPNFSKNHALFFKKLFYISQKIIPVFSMNHTVLFYNSRHIFLKNNTTFF
jgi:hypothetical protein